MNKQSIVKGLIKQILPPVAKTAWTRVRTDQIQRKYETLSLEETFSRIYAVKAWNGDSEQTCSSGFGSIGKHAEAYCALLKGLLAMRRVHSLADLGCGNFNIGKELADMAQLYTGVDIAQSVIDENTRLYGNGRVSFVRGDLTAGCLPRADVCVVRQVLQHLSNSEVHVALRNIQGTYPVAFVTEHVYIGQGYRPNLDIVHGPGTRVPKGSGLFLDQPPFNVAAAWAGDIPYAANEVLRTWELKGALRSSY